MKRTITFTIVLLLIATLSGCKDSNTSAAAETQVDAPSSSMENLRVANSPMPSADTDARDDDPSEPQQMTLDEVRAIVQEKRFNLSPEGFAAFAGELREIPIV